MRHKISKRQKSRNILKTKHKDMLEINATEARHLIRLIDKELTIYKSSQSVVSEIRLRELKKKLKEVK